MYASNMCVLLLPHRHTHTHCRHICAAVFAERVNTLIIGCPVIGDNWSEHTYVEQMRAHLYQFTCVAAHHVCAVCMRVWSTIHIICMYVCQCDAMPPHAFTSSHKQKTLASERAELIIICSGRAGVITLFQHSPNWNSSPRAFFTQCFRLGFHTNTQSVRCQSNQY